MNNGSYPVDNHVTEDELWVGHGPIRPRPCRCGGWIEPEHADGASIFEAVLLHNQTRVHQEWRAVRDGGAS